ncbi:MAG: Gfo/Idh/MocA family oxidoreductase [bacterium]
MRTVRADVVRMGVIGAGRMARIGHLHWLARHPSVRIVGIADTRLAAARDAARRYHAEGAFSSGEELLEKAKPHAVVVCTPPWHHKEAVVSAARNKVHVLCEKPMALTARDCGKMIKECSENEVFLRVGFVNRFDPGFMKVKELIRRGDAGRIFHMTAAFHMYLPDPDTPPLKQVFDAARALGLKDEDIGIWRTRDPRAGGVLADLGVHMIDLMRWFAGENVTNVSGSVQKVAGGRVNEDHAACFLTFESGAAADIQAGLCRLTGIEFKIHGEVHGSRMSLGFTQDASWFMKGPPLYYNVYAHVKKYTRLSIATRRWYPVAVLHGRNYFMCKQQTDNFIKTVTGKGGGHPGVGEWWAATGEDGLEAVRIVERIYRDSGRKPGSGAGGG